MNLIQIIYKRKVLILICTLVVLVLGTVYSFVKQPLYLSSISVTTFLVENFKMEKHIELLTFQIEDQDIEALSKTLNVDSEIAEHLVDVSIVKPLNNNFQYDIEITVTDTAYIPALFEGIIYYLNSTEYNAKRFELESEKLDGILNASKGELEDIDEVQEKLKDQESLLLYPSSLHKEFVDITEKYEETKVNRSLLSVVEIIRSYYIPSKPFSPKKPLLIMISLFAGVFIGIGLAVILELANQLKRVN